MSYFEMSPTEFSVIYITRAPKISSRPLQTPGNQVQIEFVIDLVESFLKKRRKQRYPDMSATEVHEKSHLDRVRNGTGDLIVITKASNHQEIQATLVVSHGDAVVEFEEEHGLSLDYPFPRLLDYGLFAGSESPVRVIPNAPTWGAALFERVDVVPNPNVDLFWLLFSTAELLGATLRSNHEWNFPTKVIESFERGGSLHSSEVPLPTSIPGTYYFDTGPEVARLYRRLLKREAFAVHGEDHFFQLSREEFLELTDRGGLSGRIGRTSDALPLDWTRFGSTPDTPETCSRVLSRWFHGVPVLPPQDPRLVGGPLVPTP